MLENRKRKTLGREALNIAKWFFIVCGVGFIGVLFLAEAQETRFKDIHTARIETIRAVSCETELKIYKGLVDELVK